MTDKEILLKAKSIFPPWTDTLDEAWNQMASEKLKPDYVQNNFYAAVVELEEKAYSIFTSYEMKAFPYLVVTWMEAHGTRIEQMHREGVTRSLEGKESLGGVLKGVVNTVVHDSYPLIKEFQNSIGQMRKKRAGETFQEIIRRLLVHVGISCVKARGEMEAILGHTDLVVPDIDTAINTPDKAFFMACQHTLAERWWAATPMATRGRRGYLVTLDKKLGEKKANRMKEHNLVVFVRDDLKQKPELKDMRWIRPLSALPKELKQT